MFDTLIQRQIEVPLLQWRPSGEADETTRRHLLDVAKAGGPREWNPDAQDRGQCCLVHGEVEIVQCEKTLELRRERQPAIEISIIERSLAETVSRQSDRVELAVVESERKHAVE